MRRKIEVLFWMLMGACYALNAQPWLNKTFSYDSILNINYGSAIDFLGNQQSLALDLYLPRCADSAQTYDRPLILFFHGGAFLSGSKEDAAITDFCKQFARRGYVSASVNYRLGFIPDAQAWNCNYPNYNCIFAGDSIEWYRAGFRALQDARGSIRYLINRYQQFGIDTQHVFVAGESAGAIIALAAGLLDDPAEKPAQAFAQAPLPAPHPGSSNCSYFDAGSFPLNPVSRPDLGDIQGDIEPSAIQYTIRGIGNIYGAMFSNLLSISQQVPKPAIYSFHRACDIIVPIDSAKVFWGLSWCMTNGYGCFGIQNTPKVYGSRTISDWNIQNNHGYLIEDHFNPSPFPYQYLFGSGSCIDQASNPCHAIDNRNQREQEMAQFFASLITISNICDTTQVISSAGSQDSAEIIFINNNDNIINIIYKNKITGSPVLFDLAGRVCEATAEFSENRCSIDVSTLPQGLYFLRAQEKNGRLRVQRLIRQ